MNIIVPIKQVPSLADELEITAAGTGLDFDQVSFVLNEWDAQAIEQAVLIKEASGGTVTVVGIDLIGEIDNLLYTALARGADKGVKLTGDFAPGLDSHTHARRLADVIRNMAPDLVLTGVQAPDDLDGQIAPMLAAYLDLPYVGVVNSVTVADGMATVRKEYAGGIMAEFVVRLPMVVGVQAASQPPRYAPVSKVRQIARTATIDMIEAAAGDAGAGIRVRQLAKPVAAGHAEMIGGDAKVTAARIVEILKQRGLLS